MSTMLVAAVAVTTAQDEKDGQSAQRATEVGKKVGLPEEQILRLQAQRGLSYDSLEKMPPKKLARAVKRLEYPDLPRQRVEFRLLQQRDSLGHIPFAARYT